MLALPTLLLAIAVVAVLGPGLSNAMLAVAIVQLPGFVRLTRAAVLVELRKDYVAASRMAGAGRARLMFLTVLPNCLAPLIVQASLGSPAPFLIRPRSGSSALARNRRRRNGAPCWPMRCNSCRARWWVVTFPGSGDPADGAWVQSRRRWLARCAGSAAETWMSLLEIRNLTVTSRPRAARCTRSRRSTSTLAKAR